MFDPDDQNRLCQDELRGAKSDIRSPLLRPAGFTLHYKLQKQELELERTTQPLPLDNRHTLLSLEQQEPTQTFLTPLFRLAHGQQRSNLRRVVERNQNKTKTQTVT